MQNNGRKVVGGSSSHHHHQMYFVMYVICTIWQHLSFLYQLVGRGRICQAKKNHLFPVPRRRDFWKIWKLFFIFLKIMHFLDDLGPRNFFSSRDEKNFACGAHFFLVVMTNIGFWYLIVSIVTKSDACKGTDKMRRNHHTSLVVYSPFGSILKYLILKKKILTTTTAICMPLVGLETNDYFFLPQLMECSFKVGLPWQWFLSARRSGEFIC